MARVIRSGLDTPSLPKPFIPVTVKTVMLYDEEGNHDFDGKMRVYLDPRGKTEFAVGVPAWMERILKTKLARRSYSKGDVMTDKAGNFYVLAPTAEQVIDKFNDVMRKAVERKKAIGGKTYIGLFFSGEGPKFDAQGDELVVPEDRPLRLRSSIRGHTEDIHIRLSTALGVLVEEDGSRKFFEEDEDGKLHQRHLSGDENPIFIEDTPDNRAKVLLIRRTLASAIDMLADLFGKEAEHFLRTMALAPTLRLAPPEPEEKLPRMPTRPVRIRRRGPRDV